MIQAGKTSKISIALCTYNGAGFLPEQLESFLKLTRLPDELVIGDDCSSDKTKEIIEDFAKTAPFPVYLRINEKNSGLIKNFEQTIMRCAGDLIFLSDQDDVWLPEKLEKITSEFEKSENVGLVFSDAELVGENLETLGHNLWEFSFTEEEQQKAAQSKMLDVLIGRNVVAGATMAFRSRFRKLFSPIPTDIPFTIHDAWIGLIIAAVANAVFINQPLIKYRQHAGQQVGIDWQIKKTLKAKKRSERYEDSILCQIKDLERLAKIKEILPQYPQLQTTGADIRIAGLIELSMMENNERIKHYETRKNLSLERLRRVIPIWREIMTGRYHRFSRGFGSSAKDLWED